MSSSIQQHWDDMYSRPLNDIPWEIAEPPIELVEHLSGKNFNGMEALDIGCGTGNYTIFIAEQGFEQVTGVDFSNKAIGIAKNVSTNHQNIQFILGDVTKLQSLLGDKKFDFVLDYSILHHIAPTSIKDYAAQFTDLLKPWGDLLLVCYSDKDKLAHGSSSAKGKYGNTMYYRSKEEIESLYEGLTLRTYKEAKLGKHLHHQGHFFLFTKM